jgi:SAM-dependent methyltransferase
MNRVPVHELLDDGAGSPADIAACFDDLWRINRWLGGVSGSVQLIRRFLMRTGARRATLLDVGAGDGRMARELTRRSLRLGAELRFAVLDRRVSHLRMLASRGPISSVQKEPPRVAADVESLPFGEGSFDAVTCNLFLHHFSGPAVVSLLSNLLSVAREAVLINDLERRAIPYWFIRHARWFTRSPITRHDGPASVRQAYTRAEMASLAEETGVRSFDVFSLPCFRLGAILWKRAI